MRPLDRFRSIKLKLSIVILAAVAVSAAMSQIGFRLGWPVWLRPIIAGCVSLLMVQFLAHGMTSPLRQMVGASKKMAQGDYGQRVRATSNDEVGELARSFNSMADDLAELDANRRSLISNAAHELRTPIAGLHATVENLADGVVDPTPEVLERLHNQTERLGHLVTNLLDLSRLESPDVPIRADRIELARLVDDVIDRLDGSKLTCHLDRTVGLIGDADLLERLLENLLTNAQIHGRGRDVEVHVERRRDTVLLSVADSGPGFPAGDAARLFDRFYRGEGTRGDGRPGAGLGLAICGAIAGQHGATITAQPNEIGALGRLKGDETPKFRDVNAAAGCVVTVVFPADAVVAVAPSMTSHEQEAIRP